MFGILAVGNTLIRIKCSGAGCSSGSGRNFLSGSHWEISGESAATDFTGKKILLVEDNTLNEEIAKAILQDRGFVVDSAFDGTEAVAKMESSKGNLLESV